jgi:hypothetical protein
VLRRTPEIRDDRVGGEVLKLQGVGYTDSRVDDNLES